MESSVSDLDADQGNQAKDTMMLFCNFVQNDHAINPDIHLSDGNYSFRIKVSGQVAFLIRSWKFNEIDSGGFESRRLNFF